MRITEIVEKLMAWSPINRENRSDVVVYGDIERDVSNIAVCLIATPDVLRRAKALGAEFLITHEPTFHDSIARFKNRDEYIADPVFAEKRKLIEMLDIPIFRFHDHSHFTDVDKIHAGFVKKLGLAGSFDGQRTLVLKDPITVTELERVLAERMDLKHIRFVGQRDKAVKRIALCAGAWGESCVYDQLNRAEIDLVICGEICEWSICEYVRDSAQLGIHKALFVLGHMSSERCGMEYICQYINETMAGVSATYLDCGEVYQSTK